MAKISKPPVPAKLYKHFAAATLVMTAAIAMFADEGQRASAEQISHEPSAPLEKSRDVPAYGVGRLLRAEPAVKGSFGDEGGAFGAPMMTPGGEVGGRSSIARRAVSTDRQPLPNMTPEEVAALPQDEYERLRALYVAAGAIEDVDRSAQISEVEAASARRMGHGGSDS